MTADANIKPGPVPADVLTYWRQKNLKPGFDYRDVWNEEHDYSFTAAKIMRHDVLATLQGELERAISQGLPYEKFRKDIEPRLREIGWWQPQNVQDPVTGKQVTVDPPSRLHRIFETNMRTARAVGQWDRIQRTKKSRPYLLYQIGPSARHREQHVAWHGLLLPVDDPFWSYAFPPNGWGCKCNVRSVSKSEAESLESIPMQEPELDDNGVPTGHITSKSVQVVRTAPKLVIVPWENKRTGTIELVPKGIDPGFHHTPGEGRNRALVPPPDGLPPAPAPAPIEVAPAPAPEPVSAPTPEPTGPKITLPALVTPSTAITKAVFEGITVRSKRKTEAAAVAMQNDIRDRYGLAPARDTFKVKFFARKGKNARRLGYMKRVGPGELEFGIANDEKDQISTTSHEMIHGLGGVGANKPIFHGSLRGVEEWSVETLSQHYMGPTGEGGIKHVLKSDSRAKPLLERLGEFESELNDKTVEVEGGSYRKYRERVALAVSHAEDTRDVDRVRELVENAAMLWRRKQYDTPQEAEDALIEALQPDSDEKRTWYRQILVNRKWE